MAEQSMKKILVIEDDQFYSSIFQRKLTKEGFEVHTAADGEQGIAQAKEIKPDLILLDMIMPVKDGFETLKELKADQNLKDINVIVLSNLGQENDIASTKTLGAVDYIVKANMSVQEMVEKIRKYIAL